MISLNYRDPRPVYEQIKDGLRKLVISGTLQPGEKLPSVRELASSLAINPNTIQRAYRDLETEGYIYTVLGRGSFAAQAADMTGFRVSALLRQLDEAAAELVYLGFTAEQLCSRLTHLGNKEVTEKND